MIKYYLIKYYLIFIYYANVVGSLPKKYIFVKSLHKLNLHFVK